MIAAATLCSTCSGGPEPGIGRICGDLASSRARASWRGLSCLVGVAGGITGAALGAAENLGIKDDFKQRVQHMLEAGTSAILVILRTATYTFAEALRPYGGTILRTSLSHEAEQQLVKILHGEDPKVATWEQPTASAEGPASAT